MFQKYGIKAPETGNDLSEPYEFNLMFPAPIGPAGLIKGSRAEEEPHFCRVDLNDFGLF